MSTLKSTDPLHVDPVLETEAICAWLRKIVRHQFRRKGVVVALSGGVDSSVTAALCVEAFGKERVFGLLMPEQDSSAETPGLSRMIVDHLGIDAVEEDITGMLEAAGCYRERVEAVRSVMPEFEAHWPFKIVLPNLLEKETLRLFSVIAQDEEGREHRARLSTEAYLRLVAATNFKQRVRKMREYFHADRLNYAVVGTPNRLEYELGFFVKLGDGAADVKPIAHLYKTQVYQLGAHLGVPDEILAQAPSTDTYSLPQTQEEFYFAVPYDQMDLCLHAKDNGIAPGEVGKTIGLGSEQVERIFRDIEAKRRVAAYLKASPMTRMNEV